jgi:hypothetical protein
VPSAASAPCRRGAGHDKLEEVGVSPSKSVGLTRQLQPLHRELTNDLQHREAWLSLERVLGTDEGLVHERGNAVKDARHDVVGAHGLGRLQREAASEHGEPANSRESHSSRRS